MMAISRGISMEELAVSPGVTTIISVNSPRRFDEAMADGLMAIAELRQPISVTPFTLMGAMTPVTLPAALAQQNAEALFGMTLIQLVDPGARYLRGLHLERRYEVGRAGLRDTRECEGKRNFWATGTSL